MSWITSALFKALIEWVASKIAALIALYKRDKENHEKQEAQAKQDTEAASKLNPESEGDEITDANKDTLSHL